ncbi:hypothetical protein AXW83_11735 [Bosea sp. PAMC 26642]|nr:hypothetical protein AXW83_11735 [Bosea sp. PAMC 26642]
MGAAFLEPAAAGQLDCLIAARYECSQSDCAAIKVEHVHFVDEASGFYSRCNALQCETLRFSPRRTGSRLSIVMPEQGIFADLDLGTMTFTEIQRHDDAVSISFGRCGIPQ